MPLATYIIAAWGALSAPFLPSSTPTQPMVNGGCCYSLTYCVSFCLCDLAQACATQAAVPLPAGEGSLWPSLDDDAERFVPFPTHGVMHF